MAEANKVPMKPEGKSHAPSMYRLSSWQPFESLRHEIDRLFDDVTHGFGGLSLRRRLTDIGSSWSHERMPDLAVPAVDVTEKEEEYHVTAELPGMDAGNVEVAVANDMLTIKGEKREKKEEKDKNYHLSERRFGSFERSFRLPSDIDQSKIEADFHGGVLTVVLPKAPEAQSPTKKIAIKTS